MQLTFITNDSLDKEIRDKFTIYYIIEIDVDILILYYSFVYFYEMEW